MMKRIIAFAMCMTVMLNFTACGNQETVENPPVSGEQSEEVPAAEASQVDSTSGKILIAYFSVPEDVDTEGVDAVSGASVVVKDGEKLGNTEYVAKTIQQTIGGDLFRIETVNPYPVDHDPLLDAAAAEQDSNARPELAAVVENFEEYDVIFIGYPNWWYDMPMAIYSFVDSYDFTGKTLIPFVTHGGSGASSSFEKISELQSGTLLSENALILARGDVADSEKEVKAWAEGLGIKK